MRRLKDILEFYSRLQPFATRKGTPLDSAVSSILLCLHKSQF